MIKKILVIVCMLFVSLSHASKLSRFLENSNKEEHARQEREWREDMNFSDFAFRLEKSYTDSRGQRCRDYVFRSRSNPFRNGYYSICDADRHGTPPPRVRVE